MQSNRKCQAIKGGLLENAPPVSSLLIIQLFSNLKFILKCLGSVSKSCDSWTPGGWENLPGSKTCRVFSSQYKG